jgi:hypothetical protein
MEVVLFSLSKPFANAYLATDEHFERPVAARRAGSLLLRPRPVLPMLGEDTASAGGPRPCARA